jgi:glycosyltransferase involved in cell wall biosynthesis
MRPLSPTVTVLMPVYNTAAYLREAVESILNQTYRDFELLVINDGSTDESPALLESFSDPRIRIVHNPVNSGLIATLNRGMELAQGKYIVRMDSDDISLPERVEKQVQYMESHPETGISGTWARIMGTDRMIRYEEPDAAIRIRHLYQIHLIHPSVIMRKELIERHSLRFDESFKHAEDFDFFTRASAHMKLANLPLPLLLYRQHAGSVSFQHREIQEQNTRKVLLMQFSRLGFTAREQELELYRRFAESDFSLSREAIRNLAAILQKMALCNRASHYLPEPDFRQFLCRKWYHICVNAPELRGQRHSTFRLLTLHEPGNPGYSAKVKLLIKSSLGL